MNRVIAVFGSLPLVYFYQKGKVNKQYTELHILFEALFDYPRDALGLEHLHILTLCLEECQADPSIPLGEKLLKQVYDYYIAHSQYYFLKTVVLQWLNACPHLLLSPKIPPRLLNAIKLLAKPSQITEEPQPKEESKLSERTSELSVELEQVLVHLLEERKTDETIERIITEHLESIQSKQLREALQVLLKEHKLTRDLCYPIAYVLAGQADFSADLQSLFEELLWPFEYLFTPHRGEVAGNLAHHSSLPIGLQKLLLFLLSDIYFDPQDLSDITDGLANQIPDLEVIKQGVSAINSKDKVKGRSYIKYVLTTWWCKFPELFKRIPEFNIEQFLKDNYLSILEIQLNSPNTLLLQNKNNMVYFAANHEISYPLSYFSNAAHLKGFPTSLYDCSEYDNNNISYENNCYTIFPKSHTIHTASSRHQLETFDNNQDTAVSSRFRKP